MNENSFYYHKKGKKHINAINNLKGSIPSIDSIDKSMFKNPEEEERIWWIANAEFIVVEIKKLILNVVNDTQNQIWKK